MDRRTIIIVILLGLLVIFWIPIMTKFGVIKPSKKPSPTLTQQEEGIPYAEDTAQTAVAPAKTAVDTIVSEQISIQPDTLPTVSEDSIVVETNYQKIVLSNYGGAPVSIQLKNYDYVNDGHIEMIPECQIATPEFKFNGETENANNYIYDLSYPQKYYSISSGNTEIVFTYSGRDGGSIIKKYRFYADRYDFDLIIEVTDPDAMKIERKYSLEWNNKLSPTELDLQDDYNSMWAMAKMADVRVKFDDYDDNRFDQTLDGQTNWVAARSKYFATIMIPQSRAGAGVRSTGQKISKVIGEKKVDSRVITAGLIMEVPYGEPMIDSFTVYAGPLDYDILDSYKGDLPDLLDIGTTPFVGWIIKIFAVPILWIMPRLYSIIPNYGLVIIVFSLLIKIITWPLSRKSVKSMAAMRDIQPKIKELQEKHKKNPQALNREMMKLYKEHGVNPLSGCLPLLPQMPLFFALFAVFRSTILLRQAPFVLWWDDLSRGATSFTDPYIILVIIMVVLMFVQQKMAMTDPKNKALTYVFPIMLGVLFYKASAGLILYWTMFSLFSFLEQLAFKRSKPAAETEKN